MVPNQQAGCSNMSLVDICSLGSKLRGGVAVLSLLWVQLLVMPFICTLLQGQKPQPRRSPRKDLLQSSVIFPSTQDFLLSAGRSTAVKPFPHSQRRHRIYHVIATPIRWS